MSFARDHDKFLGITPCDPMRLSDRHRKILRVLSGVRCTELLDIGCGDGNFTMLAAREAGAELAYGVDVSPKAVEMARSRGVLAECLDLDNQDLPFEPECFDVVLCGEVIEHLFDPDRLLDNVWRVLRPGGVFVLTTPNLASIYNRIALLLGFQPFDTAVSLRHEVGHLIEVRDSRTSLAPGVDHVRMFTYKSLLRLLELHGFKPFRGFRAIGASIETWGALPAYLRFIRFIDQLVCLVPSLSFRVVVATTKGRAP